MIILGIVMLLLFYFVVSKVHKIDMEQMEKFKKQVKKDCPPHRWSYHPVTDKLTCQECNFEAGSGFNPRGDQ